MGDEPRRQDRHRRAARAAGSPLRPGGAGRSACARSTTRSWSAAAPCSPTIPRSTVAWAGRRRRTCAWCSIAGCASVRARGCSRSRGRCCSTPSRATRRGAQRWSSAAREVVELATVDSARRARRSPSPRRPERPGRRRRRGARARSSRDGSVRSRRGVLRAAPDRRRGRARSAARRRASRRSATRLVSSRCASGGGASTSSSPEFATVAPPSSLARLAALLSVEGEPAWTRRNATTRSLRPEVGRLWIRRAFRDWPGPRAALGGCGRGTDEARARARIDSRSRRGRDRGRAALRATGRARAGGGARRPGRLAATARRAPAGAARAGRVALGERRGAAGGGGRSARGVVGEATGCARRRSATRGRGLAAGGRRSPTTRRCGTTAAAVCGPAGAACVQALVLELDPAERRELAGDGNEAEVYSRLFHGRAASERRFAATAARHGLDVFYRVEHGDSDRRARNAAARRAVGVGGRALAAPRPRRGAGAGALSRLALGGGHRGRRAGAGHRGQPRDRRSAAPDRGSRDRR